VGDRRAEILPGDRAGTWLVRVGGRDQSLVDLEDPTRLDFDYVRRMGDVLDGLAPTGKRVRVLHVGGAGLTLARYVAATRPGSAQVVLEPDEGLTALVREHLPLPRRSGVKVRPVDGRTGVAALRDGSWDAVVVDAFVDGEVPWDLRGAEFLADVARVLAPTGAAVLNLDDAAPFPRTRPVVAALRASFRRTAAAAEQATLRGRRPGNVVLLGAGDDRLVGHLRRRAARGAQPSRVLDHAQVRDTFGGGRPVTSGGA
jgi:spermidine synthase